MAYGIKYKLSFCTPSGVPVRYEILKRDYTGTQYDVEGTGSPFVLNKSGSSIDSALVPTEVIIQIRENANFNTQEIITSDEKEYQVKYYENNVLEWMGYLLPDFFDRELSGFPVIELTAVDHIGMLKDIPYQNTNGKPFQERQNLLTVLTNCIKKTDLPLNIKVVVDIVCDEWDSASGRSLNFFQDTYIESSRFSDDRGNVVSVHDVLETTLNLANARIYIEGGHFWVTNRREIELGIGTVYTFDQLGNQIGLGIPLSPKVVNFDLLDVGGMQEVVPANSATQIYSEHGPSFPTPKNRIFQGYNAGTYPNWTNHNGYQIEDTFVNVDRYNANGTIAQQGVTEIPRPWVRSKVTIQHVAPYDYIALNSAPYTESEAMPLSSPLDIKSINFNVGLKGFQKDIFVAVVTLKVYNSDNTLNRIYLLRESGDWGDWTNFQQQELSGYFLRMQIPTRETNTGLPNYNSVEKVFTLSAAPIPTVNVSSGTRVEMNVRLYGHTLGDANTHMMTIQSLSLDIDYGNEPKGILFSSINDGHFTKKTDPLLTLFSDKITSGKGVPFVGIARTITSNLITRTGKLTENWTGLGNSVSGFLNMVVANQLGSSSNAARKRLSISIDSGKLSLNDRYTISCIAGTFMAYNLSYDPYRESVKLDLIECLTVNRSDRNTITTPDDSDKGTNIKGVGSIPSGGGNSAPQDLQSVTDIGAETTNIMTAKGLRATDLLTVPNKPSEEPFAIYAYEDGSSAPDIPPWNPPIASANTLGVIRIGNGLAIDPVTGILTALAQPVDLTGYARESWVNQQGFLKSVDLSGYATEGWSDARYIRNQTNLQAGASLHVLTGKFVDLLTVPSIASSEPFAIYALETGESAPDIDPWNLPIASATVLGGVRIGNGLQINPVTGVVSALAMPVDLSNYFTKAESDFRYAYKDGVNASGTWGIDIGGGSKYLRRADIRRISPSSSPHSSLEFGFTTYNNSVLDNPPYADFLHLRSFENSSGGNDNLLVLNKQSIGMRLFQQVWGSASPYTSYKDVAFEQDITLQSVTDRGYTTTQPLRARWFEVGGVSQQLYVNQDRLVLYNSGIDVLSAHLNGDVAVSRHLKAPLIGILYSDGLTYQYIQNAPNNYTMQYVSQATSGQTSTVHQFIGYGKVLLDLVNNGDAFFYGKLYAPTIQATSLMIVPNTPNSHPYSIYAID